MTNHQKQRRLDWGLKGGMVLVGLAILGLSYSLVLPLVANPGATQDAQSKVKLPPFDYRPWHALPVESGRTMPFESACVVNVRQISGKSRFEKQDPVAIVLAWMMAGGQSSQAGYTDWENHPFILCDHQRLRKIIYSHQSAEELTPTNDPQLHPKHVSPADLRASPDFEQLLADATKTRRADPEKAHFQLTTEQLKAEEVVRRLTLYDSICGRLSTRLYRNAFVNDRYLDLA